MSVAAALVSRVGDESRVSSLARSSTVEAGLAHRARIVLLAAQGVPNAEIGRRVGVSRPTVIDDVAVVVATIQAPPEALG